MATVQTIIDKTTTYFDAAKLAIADAQEELSLAIANNSSNFSYAATDVPTITGTITDISGSAASFTETSYTPVTGYSPSNITGFDDVVNAIDGYVAAITALRVTPITNLDINSLTTWAGTGWDTLKTNIEAFISASSPTTTSDAIDLLTVGSTATQNSLYAADQERKQQTLKDLYAAAAIGTGAKGFTYPNSMTVALKLDAQQKYQMDLKQAARDLIKEIFVWAKENYQFALGKSIDAHRMDSDFTTKFAELTIQVFHENVMYQLESLKFDLSLLIAEIEANAKSIVAQLEQEKIKAEAHKAEDLANIAASEITMKSRAAGADLAKASASYSIEKNKLEIEAALRAAEYTFKTYTNMLQTTLAVRQDSIRAAIAGVEAAGKLAASASSSIIGIENNQ